jgi:hypothetical protein
MKMRAFHFVYVTAAMFVHLEIANTIPCNDRHLKEGLAACETRRDTICLSWQRIAAACSPSERDEPGKRVGEVKGAHAACPICTTMMMSNANSGPGGQIRANSTSNSTCVSMSSSKQMAWQNCVDLPGEAKVPKWEGAYNATHVDEIPRSDGPVSFISHTSYVLPYIDKAGVALCQTQVNFTDMTQGGKIVRNMWTCTSCKAGNAFVMMYHKARVGKCVPYKTVSEVKTTTLNKNHYAASPQEGNILSTKVLLSSIIFEMRWLKEGKAAIHFKVLPVSRGKELWGELRRGEAECLVR